MIMIAATAFLLLLFFTAAAAEIAMSSPCGPGSLGTKVMLVGAVIFELMVMGCFLTIQVLM